MEQDLSVASERAATHATKAGSQPPLVDYRHVLRREFDERVRKNPRYSLRAFARRHPDLVNPRALLEPDGPAPT